MLIESAHKAGGTVGIVARRRRTTLSSPPSWSSTHRLSLTPDAVVLTWRCIAALEAARNQ
jgi:hypothetical protein